MIWLYVLIVALGDLDNFTFHLARFYHYMLTPAGQTTKYGGKSYDW